MNWQYTGMLFMAIDIYCPGNTWSLVVGEIVKLGGRYLNEHQQCLKKKFPGEPGNFNKKLYQLIHNTLNFF